ncbi:MAG: hypothetical protein SV062_09275 [Thermodesulfobacteriota bacterium]|nr:hypothetical protein [Thermodesulfobacteriota bacterium]
MQIPDGPGVRCVPVFIGKTAYPRPLPPKKIPQHPLLSPVSGIHSDSYNSDVDGFAGPLGINPHVHSSFIGMCPIIMFDGDGRLAAVSFDPEIIGMGITAIDPDTLEVIDRYPIPFDLKKMFTGGAGDQGVSVNGAYFHLDSHGKAIVGTQNNYFQEFQLHDDSQGQQRWVLTRSIDLQSFLPGDQFLIDTQYDWNGNVWFVSSEGIVGYIDYVDHTIHTTELVGELIENGIAVAEDGVYILTSEAAYRFEISPFSRRPGYTWRIPYDRGTIPKPGTFALGSGSTPTLLGDDLITFTDNADYQVNLLVYRRGKHILGERFVGKVPLFEPGASAVDVSMIGHYNSIIVQNIYNAGKFLDDYRNLSSGLTRIDVREDRSGCDVVWVSNVRTTTVSKLSTENGLIYTYTQLLGVHDPVDAWYLTAIDFHTGKVIFRVLTGTGPLKNNAFGGLAIGPNGTVYQGVVGGIISVRDSATSGGKGLKK